MYRKVGTVLLSLTTLCQPAVLLARAPDSRADDVSDVDEAGDLITKGIALRRAGEDARALELFQQAERLQPDSTRVQVHLAASYQALGHWEAADRYLTLALADPSDPYIQKHQGTLAAARRTIDGHIGSLQLVGGPRGTEIRLNGRLVGTLPIAQTLRIEAGIYTLEARLPGHYPITRSVALAGGALARESITLSPRGADVRPVVAADERPVEEGSSRLTWLPWTFTGLAVGAGVVTVAAWAQRERHVDRWNDDSECLRPGQTRGDVCAEERRDGDRAETWMWIGAATTGAFAAASVVTFWLGDRSKEEPMSALRCGVGFAQIGCAGQF
jgi:hypothetical protein